MSDPAPPPRPPGAPHPPLPTAPRPVAAPQAAALRVAPLQAADVGRYRALMLHAYAADADAFTSTPEERAAQPEAWWLQRIADPRGLSVALGAFDAQGALLGTVALEFNTRTKTRHTAELLGMFVAEAARGRGAGRALVQAALQHAAQRPGLRRVKLTVTQGNAAAVALYHACGFEAFGREAMAIAVPGRPQGPGGGPGADTPLFKAKLHMACRVGPDAPAVPARPMLAAQIGGLRFWVRVAAVLRQGRHLLLHRLAGDDFWTLPGGRLEAGEDAQAALRREFQEELGQAITCGELACTVEHFFAVGGLPYQELGLYFHAQLPPGAALADVGRSHAGVEGGQVLEFRWFTPAELAALDIRPAVLKPGLVAGRLPAHLVQPATAGSPVR